MIDVEMVREDMDSAAVKPETKSESGRWRGHRLQGSSFQAPRADRVTYLSRLYAIAHQRRAFVVARLQQSRRDLALTLEDLECEGSNPVYGLNRVRQRSKVEILHLE